MHLHTTQCRSVPSSFCPCTPTKMPPYKQHSRLMRLRSYPVVLFIVRTKTAIRQSYHPPPPLSSYLSPPHPSFYSLNSSRRTKYLSQPYIIAKTITIRISYTRAAVRDDHCCHSCHKFPSCIPSYIWCCHPLLPPALLLLVMLPLLFCWGFCHCCCQCRCCATAVWNCCIVSRRKPKPNPKVFFILGRQRRQRQCWLRLQGGRGGGGAGFRFCWW